MRRFNSGPRLQEQNIFSQMRMQKETAKNLTKSVTNGHYLPPLFLDEITR